MYVERDQPASLPLIEAPRARISAVNMEREAMTSQRLGSVQQDRADAAAMRGRLDEQLVEHIALQRQQADDDAIPLRRLQLPAAGDFLVQPRSQ